MANIIVDLYNTQYNYRIKLIKETIYVKNRSMTRNWTEEGMNNKRMLTTYDVIYMICTSKVHYIKVQLCRAVFRM